MRRSQRPLAARRRAQPVRQAIVVGASRGLGYALVEEYLRRKWRVLATVRQGRPGALHDLKAAACDRLEVATLDITNDAEIAALRTSVAGREFDLLFVNAGVTNEPSELIGEVALDEFVRVMVTNALSPMRVVEALDRHVRADGTIAVMSSGMGSVENNTSGGWEVYRGSKAALNTFMRSYAARNADARTLLLISPGWVRTDMGGPDADLSLAESVPAVVDVVTAQAGSPGLQFLDLRGRTVPW